MNAERDRAQLVIALGEGAEGQRMREVLDRAAERAGKPVSVWARETLMVAAGDSKSEAPIDPIVEVRLNGNQQTLLDLRSVSAMQGGSSIVAHALISGTWYGLGTSKPDELIELWKRVRRWGSL